MFYFVIWKNYSKLFIFIFILCNLNDNQVKYYLIQSQYNSEIDKIGNFYRIYHDKKIIKE